MDGTGWKAETLLSLSGLVVTTEQARRIQSLYNDLDEYDRKLLSFSPVVPTEDTRSLWAIDPATETAAAPLLLGLFVCR